MRQAKLFRNIFWVYAYFTLYYHPFLKNKHQSKLYIQFATAYSGNRNKHYLHKSTPLLFLMPKVIFAARWPHQKLI